MNTLDALDHMLKTRTLSPKSKKLYSYVIKKFALVCPVWPDNKWPIQAWLVDCHQHYSDVSVRTFYQIMKVMNYCLIDDLEMPDAMKGVKSPKVAKKQRRYFSPKELFSIITEPKNSTLDRLIVLCFLDSTARCGELCNLETESIKDGFFVSIGKTGQRKYRLNPQLCEELRELGKGHKYVFRNRFEGPMEAKQMYRMTRRIFLRAGMTGEKLGPHTLRHSAASLVAQFTKSPLAVKALLQHDNINTSMIYIHDAEDATAQLVSPLQVMNDRLGSSGKLEMPAELKLNPPPEPKPETLIEVGAGQIIDLLELEYDEVPDGLSVRPRFSSEDLRLIRRMFITATKTRNSDSDNFKAKDLYKRMMRKV